MFIARMVGAIVFGAFCSLSSASPLLLTFIPTGGNGRATITLPDQSLITEGSYRFEYFATDLTPSPSLPSGTGEAIFPAYNDDTGLPTDTIIGGMSFPNSFYKVEFTYLGNGFARGGFSVLDWNTDEEFAFNWLGSSYYTNGTLSPVVIGVIPGLWKITSVVSEPNVLHLLLLGAFGIISMRTRFTVRGRSKVSLQ